MTSGVAALVLLAAVMHASWNAALRSGRDRLWAGAMMSLAAGTAALLAAPFWPLPERASWPFIVLSAGIHVVYSLSLVRMYRLGDFGVTYPVARGSSPLLIALGGAVFSAEFVAPVNVAGIVLVSAGIFSLARGGGGFHKESVPAALLTGLSIAAYSLADGLGVRRTGNAAAYTAWMTVLHGFTMPWIFLLLRREGARNLFTGRSRTDWVQAIGGGVVSVVGYGIVIWAMQHSPMGMVSALRETSVLFAAILGRVFLGEPFTTRKMVAAILIGAGALCLHF